MNNGSPNVDDLEPIGELPTTKNLLYPVYDLLRKNMSEKEKYETDLNDKKVAWLIAVSQKKRCEMTEKEIYFYDKYKSENIDFSPFWFYNAEITTFFDEQLAKIREEIKQHRG